MYFYHLTTKESLPKIMEEGLKPMIGENSKAAGENTPLIFLCKKEDIGYWKTILGRDVVLKISGLDEDDLSVWKYDNYNEYMYRWNIPIDKISRTTAHTSRKQNSDLCVDCISSINRLCIHFAYYYSQKSQHTEEHAKELADSVDFTMNILSRLDYSIADFKEIRNIINEEAANGGFTFCDKYFGGARLWEQLILYPKDELFEKRKIFHDWIKENLEKVNLINTGGFDCQRDIAV